MYKILVIDPHDKVRRELVQRFSRAGFEAFSTPDPLQAERIFQETRVDLVVLDVQAADSNGLRPLRKIRTAYPDAVVLLTSPLASVEQAVAAVRTGAAHFFRKPYPPEALVREARSLLEAKSTAHPPPARSAPSRDTGKKIVAKSTAMRNVLLLVEKAAETDKPVLITGESGVGKTLLAEAVHARSSRSNRPLLSINCSAFPDEPFLDFELFGTGTEPPGKGRVSREGAFIKADGGTLVLEEVAFLPFETQSRLLTYLESGTIRRVGENVPLRPDTRLIATSREDLLQRVEEGRFRADLLFRLKGMAIHIPSLRERGEDIPVLIRHFLKRLHRRGGPHWRVDKEALSMLCALDYPGNVRELRNILEQVTAVCPGEVIDRETLRRADIRVEREKRGAMERVASVEKKVIEEVIRRHPRDLFAAAQELGISRTTLWRRMKKYNMITRQREADRSSS